jgi:hypothetical protein
MHTGHVGGNIGPFLDPATGQQVMGTLQGTFTFHYGGDPNAVVQQLHAGILQATTIVLQQKLATNQVALPTMAPSMPAFYTEIIGQSGAQNLGVQITQLNLTPSVQSPSMVTPPTGPLPPDPYQATANAFKQAAQERLDPSNYEVRANVNIGGFKVKASTDGGIDTDGLKKQAVDKAKSTVIWWGIGCAALLFVVAVVAAIGIYGYYEYAKSTGDISTSVEDVTWDGKSPYTCTGTKNVRIKNVTADLSSGTAVKGMGKCQIELVNCTIKAPVALDALGEVKITVTGGSITGTEFAAKAAGNSQITFKGTQVSGKTNALPPAKIVGP